MEDKKPNKILIVDDDPAFVAGLTTFLSGHGYEVAAAEDATNAMVRARDKDMLLLILDLWLPGGGGYFVLENLRRITKAAKLPIIVSTANISKGAKEKAIGMGANDFIAKPYDLEDLLSKIKLLCR